MKLELDWSDYETAGQGDAYAGIPATGGDFAGAGCQPRHLALLLREAIAP